MTTKGGGAGAKQYPREEQELIEKGNAQWLNSDRPKYDYRKGGLDENAEAKLRILATKFRREARRGAQCTVNMGKYLIEAKKWARGEFGRWLKAEFALSERTAERCMAAAREFGDRNLNLGNVAISALTFLAAPSVPEAAREEARGRIGRGERLSHKEAQKIARAHKAASGAGHSCPAEVVRPPEGEAVCDNLSETSPDLGEPEPENTAESLGDEPAVVPMPESPRAAAKSYLVPQLQMLWKQLQALLEQAAEDERAEFRTWVQGRQDPFPWAAGPEAG